MKRISAEKNISRKVRKAGKKETTETRRHGEKTPIINRKKATDDTDIKEKQLVIQKNPFSSKFVIFAVNALLMGVRGIILMHVTVNKLVILFLKINEQVLKKCNRRSR